MVCNLTYYPRGYFMSNTITVSVHTDTFGPSTNFPGHWVLLDSVDNTFEAPSDYVPCSPEVLYMEGYDDPISISTVYIDSPRGYIPT